MATAHRLRSTDLGDLAASVMGVAAFGASALHVYSTCIDRAGTGPLIAVLVTVAAELLAVVSMLELRRALHAAPVVGLAGGVALTTSANLATVPPAVDRPGFGWPELVAVAPVALFIGVLVITETSDARRRRRADQQQAEADRAEKLAAGEQHLAERARQLDQDTRALAGQQQQAAADSAALDDRAAGLADTAAALTRRAAELDRQTVRTEQHPAEPAPTGDAAGRRSPAHSVADALGISLRRAQVVLAAARTGEPAATARLAAVHLAADGTPALRVAR